MATNTHVLQAFARLEDNQAFGVIRDYLAQTHGEAIQAAVESTDLLMIGRAQGEARALGNLIHLAANARTILQQHPRTR